MPENSSAPQPKVADDFLPLADGIVATVTCGGNVTAVKRQGGETHSVAADVGNHSDVVLNLAGSASHGESNVARAAETFLQRLRPNGRLWGEPRIVATQGSRNKSGIYLEPYSPGRARPSLQVTRADQNPQL